MIMTVEEKAKAYDEAIERAKAFNNGEDVNIEAGTTLCEYIFPELKGSEDERIRKEIIEMLRNWASVHYITKEQFRERMTWLEKQGKHSIYNVPSREVILAIWNLGNEWKELTNGCISTKYGTQLNYIQKHWEESEYYLREKQGEQKPTDKVEPIFKVGDWVVNRFGDDWHIDSFDKKNYQVSDGNGYYNYFPISMQDKMHLWTIQDAKEGDVLYAEGFHGHCIFIFDKIGNWKFDEPDGDRAVATGHCCLTISSDRMEFGIQGPDCVEVNRVKPATKEQRDLLFQKIKEAGYEWDADKKELNKEE